MPAGYEARNCHKVNDGVVRFCRNCGQQLRLKIRRDLTRKWFCSRECSSKWWFEKQNRFLLQNYKPWTEEQRKKIGAGGGKRRGNRNGRFKGGYTNNWGYHLIQDNGKQRPYHCVKAEQILERHLKQEECIHHIDGNTLNNKNGNLIICTRSYHNFLHHTMSALYQQLVFGGLNVSSRL